MPSFRKIFLGSILAHPLGRREWVYLLFLRPLTILGSSQWWCPSPSRASTSVESTRGWKLKRRSDNSHLDYPLCYRERNFDNEDYHHRLFLPSSFLAHKVKQFFTSLLVAPWESLPPSTQPWGCVTISKNLLPCSRTRRVYIPLTTRHHLPPYLDKFKNKNRM